MTGSIALQIQRIRQQIPPEIRLIAVSKYVSTTAMREAYQAGIRDFGENRLQEALTKQKELKDLPDIAWHFIGHLQANKALKAIQHFQWIHSVDSLDLARRLNRLAEESSLRPKVCLQVKMVRDPHKYGWEINQLLADLPELDLCSNLNIQGLMIILPLGLSEAEMLKIFQSARDLARQIEGQNWLNVKMQELSMGMSDDYLLAIQAGATAIRLGSILFGQKSLK
jgi:hypothetical protein